MVQAENTNGKTWLQYLIVLTAGIAILTSGAYFGWPGPSLPKILSGEYPFPISAEDASYITIIGMLGDIIGSVLSILLVDRVGRKYSILMISIPQFLSLMMIYFSYVTPILLYSGRVFGGIGEGACFILCPIYIGEVADPSVRGVLGSFVTVTFVTGILVINLVGSYLSLYTTAAIFSILPVVFVILFSFAPETPYYLLMKKRTDRAAASLRILRRKQNVDKELEILSKDVQRQISESNTYRDLYKIKSNRRACIAALSIRAVQLFCGVGALTFYAQLFFAEVSDSISPAIASSLGVLLQIIFTIVSSLIVDKVGRKPLLIVSVSGCSLLLNILGVYFILHDYFNIDIKLLPVIAMLLHFAAYGMGMSSTVNLMLGELFSASIKAKATGIMQIWFAVILLVSTKLYQFLTDNVAPASPFFLFGIITFIGAFIFKYFVPETKGKTLEQIQQELKKN